VFAVIELEVSIKDKCYKGSSSVILEDMQFSVTSGEFVAIIGPSGCGKTTLLNMLSGLESNDQQTLLCNGKAIDANDEYQLSYIFQQPRLMPWLTVRENLQLVLASEDEQKVNDLLEMVGMDSKGEYYPRQLSGGMQRRVAIARAFAVNPELLLLDEPFNSLDAPTAARLRLLLVQLCKQHGSTVVFVTHDLSEAIYLADRIIFMSAAPGSIIHQVTVDLHYPRKESGSDVLAWQAQLMETYPQILAGSIDSTD